MNREYSSSDTTSIPSCENCRRKKLKCERQQPTCSNCEKFEAACVYDYEKKKPGFKVGAVESLSRRLEVVERALNSSQEQVHGFRSSPASSTEVLSNSDVQGQLLLPVVGVLSSLTKELNNLSSAISSSQHHLQHETTHTHNLNAHPSKRQRVDTKGIESAASYIPSNTDLNSSKTAQHSNILNHSDQIIESYFTFIHPWLSILHEPTCRKYSHIEAAEDPLSPVFQAMVFAALRFVRTNGEALSNPFQVEQTTRSRHTVLLSAIDTISIESTQALLIVAFTELADDRIQQASSLLGIITTHIDFLELSLEPYARKHCAGIFGKYRGPITSNDWTSEEERRRLFWNAFMLDRLCSAMTGCRPTLSTTNMGRRLPACASFWYTNLPRMTEYLRVSSTPEAEMGIPTMLRPLPNDREFTEDTSTVEKGEDILPQGMGSLAFYIESVASMGEVITHFLGQSIDYASRDGISLWLTRFKDLDAQLMRWKLRLPQQWTDSGVSRNLLPGIMDAAMTASNATHNTTLILLHERIAYPDARLHWLQLPSFCSAGICMNAATEVCRIITKLLSQRVKPYPLSPQLGLCAFVSARVLLIHWRYYLTSLAPEFQLLQQSLDDMALRWQIPPSSSTIHTKSVFSRFARRLRTLHARCELDPSYRIDRTEPLYDQTSEPPRSNTRWHWLSSEDLAACIEQSRAKVHITQPSSVGTQPQPQTFSTDLQPNMHWDSLRTTNSQSRSMEDDLTDDSLAAISQSLLDPDFTGIDRIVSFDEMMLSGISETGMTWGNV